MQTIKPEIIECDGTPYEVGRQYGEAAKQNILKSVNFMFVSLENGLFKATRDGVLNAANNYHQNVQAFDLDAIEWIQGIADGSGISFEESFALKSYLEIATTYPQISGMCTSFALTGAATENGLTILGQNIDWHPDAPIDLLRITYVDGLKQFSLCLLGNSYYYLNSKGFGCSANLTISPMGPITYHIPLAIYLWKAMRQDTPDGAMDILKKVARGVGYYHLADKNSNVIGIESVYDDYKFLYPENHSLVHANHYETEEFKKKDLASTYIQDSFGRADRLRELIADAYGSITVKKIMNFLKDHHNYPDSICNHVDKTKPAEMASESRASIIMVPEKRLIYVAFGPPCENPYWEYSLLD